MSKENRIIVHPEVEDFIKNFSTVCMGNGDVYYFNPYYFKEESGRHTPCVFEMLPLDSLPDEVKVLIFRMSENTGGLKPLGVDYVEGYNHAIDCALSCENLSQVKSLLKLKGNHDE